MKKLIVGTRGSGLAVAQTNWVIKKLIEKNKNLEIETKIIKTKGDLIQNISLEKIGSKGIFIKEIEDSLLKGEIDFAIHSMKDLPTILDERFLMIKPPAREDHRDVLVTKHDIGGISDLPPGAKIGTGSKRRRYQLTEIRKDIVPVDIRGNVETRIKKIFTENLDGVVIAKAGVNRLNTKFENVKMIELNEEDFIPAPAQGILGIEILKSRSDLEDILSVLSDNEASLQNQVERDFLMTLEGGCHEPIGAYCKFGSSNRNTLYYLYGDEEGKVILKGKKFFQDKDIENIGIYTAKEIKEELKICLEKHI